MPVTTDPPSTRRVAVLTASRSYPLHDVDRPATQAALDAAGLQHELVPWDAPFDWERVDAAVIRSTWDYTARLTEFLDTLERIAAHTPLLNPLEVVRWNVDKRYLAELASQGVPVVPTRYVEPGHDLADAVAAHPCVVVKPTVSAGAKHTARHNTTASAMAHASSLLDAGHTVMVQPYLQRVDTEAETGLVYLEGRFSHAFAKAPILDGDDGLPHTDATGMLVERITARQATIDQLTIGQRVLDALQRRFGTLLYARVDLLPGADGPVVLEVELVEPNLFLSLGAGAADAFASHLRNRLWVA
jgi:glutathione synthase/RimK-type ligase-like ATP-grasp enzyme